MGAMDPWNFIAAREIRRAMEEAALNRRILAFNLKVPVPSLHKRLFEIGS